MLTYSLSRLCKTKIQQKNNVAPIVVIVIKAIDSLVVNDSDFSAAFDTAVAKSTPFYQKLGCWD